MENLSYFNSFKLNLSEASVNIELGLKPTSERNLLIKLIIRTCNKIFSVFSDYRENRKTILSKKKMVVITNNNHKEEMENAAKKKEAFKDVHIELKAPKEKKVIAKQSPVTAAQPEKEETSPSDKHSEDATSPEKAFPTAKQSPVTAAQPELEEDSASNSDNNNDHEVKKTPAIFSENLDKPDVSKADLEQAPTITPVAANSKSEKPAPEKTASAVEIKEKTNDSVFYIRTAQIVAICFVINIPTLIGYINYKQLSEEWIKKQPNFLI